MAHVFDGDLTHEIAIGAHIGGGLVFVLRTLPGRQVTQANVLRPSLRIEGVTCAS